MANNTNQHKYEPFIPPYEQDGILYPSQADAPDIGSWEENPYDQNYYGLSSEKDKLPTYVRAGTFAITDAWEIAVFINGSWHWYDDDEEEE